MSPFKKEAASCHPEALSDLTEWSFNQPYQCSSFAGIGAAGSLQKQLQALLTVKPEPRLHLRPQKQRQVNRCNQDTRGPAVHMQSKESAERSQELARMFDSGVSEHLSRPLPDSGGSTLDSPQLARKPSGSVAALVAAFSGGTLTPKEVRKTHILVLLPGNCLTEWLSPPLEQNPWHVLIAGYSLPSALHPSYHGHWLRVHPPRLQLSANAEKQNHFALQGLVILLLAISLGAGSRTA